LFVCSFAAHEIKFAAGSDEGRCLCVCCRRLVECTKFLCSCRKTR
jgi:hypothetical protein